MPGTWHALIYSNLIWTLQGSIIVIFFPLLSLAEPHLDLFGVLQSWLPYVLLQKDLESLSGGASKGVQLLIYPWPKNSPPLSGKVILFNWAHSFGRDTHGTVRKEEGTHLVRQINQTKPGDQRGERSSNQVALISSDLHFSKKETTEKKGSMSCMWPHGY